MNELEIFSAAHEIGDSQRLRGFLDDACRGDTRLRDRVEDLLRAAAVKDSFMESPPFEATPSEKDLPETEDATLSPEVGTHVGPYKLLQKLGEGGMGTVFMAEQRHPVRRRVALKIIKPGMDSGAVVARFEAERQALSMMDHPNIAHAFDAGTLTSGRPYFAMELVKGIPITKYCDERKLTTRERLELFIPVCYAVQHAHQKGVVHRDLKPSNILIAEYDEQAIPKVIDFGVAKAIHQPLTEKTLFTQVGQIIGTLEYMSPEQAKVNELDVDTRSDIYSLGVVLYELLSGTTPHDKQQLRGAPLDELIRIIRDEEPPMPSRRLSTSGMLPSTASRQSTTPAKLCALIRGELDWIAMKALDKDRARRYQSCGEFADDIRRFLNGEQVRACPPTPIYRLKKFVRRNVGFVAAVMAVVVALAVGLVATHIQKKKTEYALYEVRAQNQQLQTLGRNSIHNWERNTKLRKRHSRLEDEFFATLNALMAQLTHDPVLQTDEFRPLREELMARTLTFWKQAIEISKLSDGSDGPYTNDYRLQRALVNARMGNHSAAYDEVLDLTARTENLPKRFSQPQYIWAADAARACSLCAEAAGDNQMLAEEYTRRARFLAAGAVDDFEREIETSDAQRTTQAISPDKECLLSELSAFLDDPSIERLGLETTDYLQGLIEESRSSQALLQTHTRTKGDPK